MDVAPWIVAGLACLVAGAPAPAANVVLDGQGLTTPQRLEGITGTALAIRDVIGTVATEGATTGQRIGAIALTRVALHRIVGTAAGLPSGEPATTADLIGTFTLDRVIVDGTTEIARTANQGPWINDGTGARLGIGGIGSARRPGLRLRRRRRSDARPRRPAARGARRRRRAPRSG